MLKKSVFRLLPFGFLCALLFAARSTVAAEVSEEYKLKAAFLVNFAKFIQWPEQTFSSGQSDLRFCVAGRNPFAETLSSVENKKIGGRPVTVQHFATLARAEGCQVLFVSQSEELNLDLLRSQPGLQQTLTVSDIPGFVHDGGMIEFVIRNNRLAFIIHRTALRERGFQISAALLELAAAVQ